MTELWEILVPASNNKSKEFSYEHHKQWDAFVKNITGGLTVMKTAKGQWINSATGTEYLDRMIPCRIACTEKQINKIIAFTMKHYDQEAVMAYRISTKVIIRHKNEIKNDDEVTHTVFFGENIRRAIKLFKNRKS